MQDRFGCHIPIKTEGKRPAGAFKRHYNLLRPIWFQCNNDNLVIQILTYFLHLSTFQAENGVVCGGGVKINSLR